MAVHEIILLNQNTPVNIPSGLVPKGAYAAGTDYAVGDSVDYLGSSYVMFVDAVAGTLPTDTTKWQVLANKGASSSGDTVSPATNTDSYIPQWNGANSKTLKDGLAVPAGGLAGLTALGDKVDKVAGSRLITTAEGTILGNTSNTNSGDNAANSTADMLLGTVQSVTAEKKFTKDKISMLGTSTGKNIVSTVNASATNYTNILPAKDGTFAMTIDITGTNSGTNTGDSSGHTLLATIAQNNFLTNQIFN